MVERFVRDEEVAGSNPVTPIHHSHEGPELAFDVEKLDYDGVAEEQFK